MGALPALRGLGIYDLTQAQTPKSQFISGMTITNPIMGTALNAMDGVQDLVSGLTNTTGAQFQGRGAGRAAFNPRKPEAKSATRSGTPNLGP